MNLETTATVVVLVEASEEETRARLAELEAARRKLPGNIVVVTDERAKAWLSASDASVLPSELSGWIAERAWIRQVYVVPRGAELGQEPHPPSLPPLAEDFVAYCPPKTSLATRCYLEAPPRIISWLCSRGVLQDLCNLVAPSSWNCTSPIRAVNQSRRSVAWLSAYVSEEPPRAGISSASAPIARSRSVLAIIPYYACDEWLELSIRGLTTQKRRPAAIVVVDDASPSSPRAIVEQYADVTLVRSPSRVGPYRLIQQVIDDTNFDAFLFQDADDFSAVDRLEKLLEEGERSGAHLIGTQALYFDWETGACGLASSPTIVPPPSSESVYSLLHPSSIVTRDLLLRLGGFASGLRFSGDMELQYRAMYVTPLINTPWCSYFKIRHRGSLTRDPETGIRSNARNELRASLRRRHAENLAAVDARAPPDLTPFRTAPPISLKRICGPPLAASWS